ncbi:flavin reductase like domain-containing protein [Mycena sp. CBHHK59/15]|nr:flavin reductase like domain-containing protein [Mycena sp. CBHHK59/15]
MSAIVHCIYIGAKSSQMSWKIRKCFAPIKLYLSLLRPLFASYLLQRLSPSATSHASTFSSFMWDKLYQRRRGHQNSLRTLLRETAQPVTVVTSLLSVDALGPRGKDASHELVYHGATLSSFTSVAMDPLPLVTFALRIPSRMASSLNSPPLHSAADMVINILSANQAHIATAFSRPDLHPHPFSTTPYILSQEGLPIIQGSLGAISCKLVSKGLPLHDIHSLQQRTDACKPPSEYPEGQLRSELFIAQVTRVETLEDFADVGENTRALLPLLYHRRKFTSWFDGDP